MVPRVTVLMPVYNGQKYLKEAVESILSQTYSDFEFVIVNDGSTDNSAEIINSFPDKRIRLVHNENNIGQANSLNKGIKLSNGQYIVRMDADDISLPGRIKKQVEFMDNNPDIGISGTWVKTIGSIIRKRQYPKDPDTIKCHLLFSPLIFHPTVIMRKNLLIEKNLYYRQEFETAEDYDLWVRASMVFPISNLEEFLLYYRTHPEQVTYKNSERQNKVMDLIRKDLLKRLNLIPNSNELGIHAKFAKGDTKGARGNTKELILQIKTWMEKLNNANKKEKVFELDAFSRVLAYKWFKICKKASRLGVWSYRIYYSTEISHSKKLDLKQKTMFFIKCGIRYNKFKI